MEALRRSANTYCDGRQRRRHRRREGHDHYRDCHDGSITLSGIRADVSGLEAGDRILATISATGSGDGFSDIGETSGASIAGLVSTVKDGLNVTAVEQISVLTCDAAGHTARQDAVDHRGRGLCNAAGKQMGMWDDTGTPTQIRIVVANVPPESPSDGRAKGNEGPTVVPPMMDPIMMSAGGIPNPDFFANPPADMHRPDGHTE